MQYINHWPDVAELNLPTIVSQDLRRHLLEPFDSEEDAKAFWIETDTVLIILAPSDSIQDSDCRDQIEFALKYPEYTENLKNGYRFNLAVVNDLGSGIFLVLPPELTNLIDN